MTLNWRDCNRINKCISLNTCSSRKKLKQLLSGQTINISTVVTKSPVTLSLDASFHNKSHETNCTTQFFFFFFWLQRNGSRQDDPHGVPEGDKAGRCLSRLRWWRTKTTLWGACHMCEVTGCGGARPNRSIKACIHSKWCYSSKLGDDIRKNNRGGFHSTFLERPSLTCMLCCRSNWLQVNYNYWWIYYTNNGDKQYLWVFCSRSWPFWISQEKKKRVNLTSVHNSGAWQLNVRGGLNNAKNDQTAFQPSYFNVKRSRVVIHVKLTRCICLFFILIHIVAQEV